MTTYPTTSPARPVPVRWLARATLFIAALGLAASAFAQPAVARADYREGDFEACMNRNMPTDYCCEHAGGVMRTGACIDPATLRAQGPGGQGTTPPTLHRPPGVVAPPPTAVMPPN